MKEPIPGFTPPTQLPQIERESRASIVELMDSAPPWSQMWAFDLANQFRSHVAIRSALGFAGEVAMQALNQLRTASTPEEIYRLQGKIQACDHITGALLEAMTEAEASKEKPQ